jgi:acyl carrier protein
VPPDTATLEASIRRFMAEVLGVDMVDIDAETSIIKHGLVDSVALVRLAAFLETELGIVIPDRDVTARHFDSLAAIDAYVRRRTQAPA